MTQSSGNTPFTISVAETAGPGLKVELFNSGKTPQGYLHDLLIQPCTLSFKGSDGRIIEGADRRMIMKFDSTPYRSMVKTLAVGKREVLFETQFERESNGHYRLDWGPIRYDQLSPGDYQVSVSFGSEIDEVFDQPGGSPEPIDIWLGTVTSEEISLHLPE